MDGFYWLDSLQLKRSGTWYYYYRYGLRSRYRTRLGYKIIYRYNDYEYILSTCSPVFRGTQSPDIFGREISISVELYVIADRGEQFMWYRHYMNDTPVFPSKKWPVARTSAKALENFWFFCCCPSQSTLTSRVKKQGGGELCLSQQSPKHR